jgi:hypothetical protein
MVLRCQRRFGPKRVVFETPWIALNEISAASLSLLRELGSAKDRLPVPGNCHIEENLETKANPTKTAITKNNFISVKEALHHP